ATPRRRRLPPKRPRLPLETGRRLRVTCRPIPSTRFALVDRLNIQLTPSGREREERQRQTRQGVQHRLSWPCRLSMKAASCLPPRVGLTTPPTLSATHASTRLAECEDPVSITSGREIPEPIARMTR